MSEILLAKPQLEPGFIDVSVGEPHVVREALFDTFNMKDWTLPTPDKCWEYPHANGYKPLVDLLEWKHGAKVVITNGAKQALGATFYALKKMDKSAITMRIPYWALIPPLMDMHGVISASTMPDPPHYSDSEFWKHEAFLLLAPNNPDGFIHSDKELIEMNKGFEGSKCPFIHDAAYYTHSYLPRTHSLPAIGDVQIYSISKMLGLSNLRVGYAVCHNQQYYKLIQEYVEATTVGVAVPSQMFTYELMNQMRAYPTLTEKFENISFAALRESKKIIQEVSPEILEVPSNYTDVPGMFGWFKVGPKADFKKAKINAIDGALFGMPGYVRMNLAFNAETVRDIVARLNSVLV